MTSKSLEALQLRKKVNSFDLKDLLGTGEGVHRSPKDMMGKERVLQIVEEFNGSSVRHQKL